MAEWARLLSECWVKPVAGSNPALPATRNAFHEGRVFVFNREEREDGKEEGDLFQAQLHPQM